MSPNTTPSSLTRLSHYASLPPNKHGGLGKAWTKESALIALTLFVEEEDAMPLVEHLNASEGMPSNNTIAYLFGSVMAYRSAYTGPPIIPKYLRSYARKVFCQRCRNQWDSPDYKNRRTCNTCLEREDSADGTWLTGMPVVLNGVLDFDDEEYW